MSVEKTASEAFPSPRENPHLFGHEAAEQVFLNVWRSERTPHAWLITGPEGIGKATFAYRVARFVLAQGADDGQASLLGPADPPNTLEMSADDPVFRRVASGGHTDLMTLSRETAEGGEAAKKTIPVDAVRGAGRFLHLTAAESSWRILIVDSADDLNINAANALLKILEEPSDNCLILLTSNAPGRLLPTIRSRCCRLSLGSLDDEAMAAVFGALGPDADLGALQDLVPLADGSPGRAIALMEADGPALLREMIAFVAGMPEIDMAALHAFGDRLARRDAESAYRTAIQLFMWWIARLARIGAGGGRIGDEIVPGEGEAAALILARCGVDRLVEVWEKCGRLAAQADGVNLDRKQVLLGVFHNLQSATRV